MANNVLCATDFLKLYITYFKKPSLVIHGELGEVSIVGYVSKECFQAELGNKFVVHRNERKENGSIIYYLVDRDSVTLKKETKIKKFANCL